MNRILLSIVLLVRFLTRILADSLILGSMNLPAWPWYFLKKALSSSEFLKGTSMNLISQKLSPNGKMHSLGSNWQRLEHPVALSAISSDSMSPSKLDDGAILSMIPFYQDAGVVDYLILLRFLNFSITMAEMMHHHGSRKLSMLSFKANECSIRLETKYLETSNEFAFGVSKSAVGLYRYAVRQICYVTDWRWTGTQTNILFCMILLVSAVTLWMFHFNTVSRA